MKLNFEETKSLIDKVLGSSKPDALRELQRQLRLMRRSTQEFYDAVIEHGSKITFYTSDQWLDFHQKVPHWRLQREKALMDKLSPNQREKLGL